MVTCIIVDALCKDGMAREAEGMFDTLKKRNIRHDIVTCNTFMDG